MFIHRWYVDVCLGVKNKTAIERIDILEMSLVITTEVGGAVLSHIPWDPVPKV